MIKLSKGPQPPILAANAALWTAELISALQAGNSAAVLRKSKYNLPAIKTALKVETHNKCAYCESNPQHVAYGDIEHVMPKSINPALTYDWSNLTYACDVCNTKKGNREGFLDPYSVDPADHLFFRGPMICTEPQNAVALATTTGLALNRTPLLEKRAERIAEIDRQVREIKRSQDDNLKHILLSALIEYVSSDATEYKACLMTHVEASKHDGFL